MEKMTITEVSRSFNVSTRMLRYYEKIGLIESARKEDYAYRIYDETAVRRLQQIIILRKLHIPLKDIAIILNDTEQTNTLHILQEKVNELNGDIEALKIIRDIITVFIKRLDKSIQDKIHIDMLDDIELIEITDALVIPKSNLKEEHNMAELNEANAKINSNMDIRFIYLPPAKVVSSHYIGENPEQVSGDWLEEFIKKINLPKLKPDMRLYGFNNPNPQEGMEHYGYEFIVTVPDHIEVQPPLEIKDFQGGLYAAHCIKMGDFSEWATFFAAVEALSEYEIDYRQPYGMGGCLEEHLNAYSYYTGDQAEFIQLDLLIPIKKRG